MVRIRRWALSAALSGVFASAAWAGPVEDARQAFDKGDYSLAAGLYERAAEATPALRDDAAFMSAWRQAEARVAYAAGALLQAEGEFDAAADQFLRAIAKDSDYEPAYAALADAQRAGVKQHLSAALDAADQGDLLAAKRRLERSLVLGGGANEDITTALGSITKPDATFQRKTLDKLAEAKRLGDDRQWGMAQRQLAALVEGAPMLLPARAELHRASRFKAMSTEMTDAAAALIAQQRLSPALAKLAGATSVWPYNERAAELLESVETQVKRAGALVDEARALSEKQDWRGANEKLIAALAIDPSLVEARALRSRVRVGLVTMLGDQARAALDDGDLARARSLIDRANQYWPNNRWSRGDLAAFQLALSQRADEAGHIGEAYLRALLASRDASVIQRLNAMERALLSTARATYAYQLSPTSPSIGVDSATLATALANRGHASSRSPATLIGLKHGEAEGERAPEDAADAAPGYTIRIAIRNTDIELRQIRTGGVSAVGTAYGTTIAGNTHYWEKYGFVEADIQVVDNATGDEITRWSARRWANYTDRQQYVIGRTWNTNYWTLPTDDAIEARLARDLAADVHEDVVRTVALAKARSIRDTAEQLAETDPAASMDQRVAAVVLAGQVNPRDARRELHRMARDLDEQHPTGLVEVAE